MGEPGFYVAGYNKGGNQKVGVLADTLMIEKEARERAGRLREANRASAAGAACTPPIGESFRHPERNPTRFEKGEPERLGRREAVCETPIQFGR
jgi:hypothetical protein